MHCSLWNVCSLKNKLPEVIEHVLDNDSDLFFITETWLTSEKNKVTVDFKEQGYILKHNTRNSSKKEWGGGTGIAVKNTIRSTQIPTKHYNSFELTVVKIPCIGDKLLLLICVYRLQETPCIGDKLLLLICVYRLQETPCIGDKLLSLICVYRLQETPFSLFSDELSDLFETCGFV